MLKIIILIFLSITPQAFAQLNVDSLWNAHKSADEPKQIEIINRLARYYLTISKFDSALILHNKILEYAELNSIDSLKAMLYSNLVYIYREKDQLDIALEYSNKALDYAIKMDNKNLQSRILINTARIYGKEGNLRREIEYTKRSLRIAEELDLKLDMAIANGNLANSYYIQGYYETAINYTLKSMEISKQIKDSIGIGYMSMQMGDNYVATKKYDEAIDYFKRAIKIFSDENASMEKADAQIGLGLILTAKNDTSEAYKTFKEAKKTYEGLNLDNGKTHAIKSLAELFFKQNKLSKARTNAQIALDYFKENDIKLDIIDTYLLLTEISLNLTELKNAKDGLDKVEKLIDDKTKLSLWENYYRQKSKYYELLGQHELAFKNNKLLMEIKDSIQNITNTAQALDLQIKYDVEAKQKENELLVTQNKLQQLKAEESETFRNFSILTIILLVIVGLVLFNRYRAKTHLNNKLREANATKDKFFSIISHDLINPFTTLLGYTDMLIMEYKNFSEEERKDYVGSIQKSAKHTFNLLENLLNWSSSQRGNIKINKTKLSVALLVDGAFKLVSETAKNKNIKLVKEIPLELMVNADEETISTVIRNLVTNAIKFTPENGNVTVSANEQNTKVNISVKDNGIGIATRNLNKIFRIDSHHTTKGTANEKGTGLGLILCKEFMKKNGGNISVNSEIGIGSKFTVSLPK